MTPILRMVDIGKSFPGVKALDGVSFEVYPGEVHALMGENGAGKSTLMKILAGAYQADAGHIEVEGERVALDTPQKAMQHGIGIIYQEFNLVPQLTIAQNIYLGRERSKGAFLKEGRQNEEAQGVMEALGVALDVRTRVETLPVAMQQMIEIAKATSRQSKIIAMDEPSATLTEHELENLYRLIRKLKESGVSIIYISHRMDEVFAISDRITVLRDGKSIATRKSSEVSPSELVQLMVGRPLEQNFPKVEATVGDTVLEVKNLSKKPLLKNISFSVKQGEVVALAGLVGSGRTEIARCIFGADSFESGEIVVNGNPLGRHVPKKAIKQGIGLVTEDRKGQGLLLGLTVRENMSLASLGSLSKGGFMRKGEERKVAASYVQNLAIRTPSIEQKVQNLSGGNQQKVVLSKWLLTHSKLLILDEPTRGIDVGAKVEIYNLMNKLAAEGLGILMISSELPEVLGMADRVLVMREGRLVGEFSRAEATQEKIGELAVGVPIHEA